MAKKYIRLNENGNLSQVVEFKDGDRMELPLNKEGSLVWYKDKIREKSKEQK